MKESDTKMKTEEFNFYNSIAFANAGADVICFTDKSKENVFLFVIIMHSVTQNDITVYLHLYKYRHDAYLDCVQTLFLNPPIDMSTHVLKGECLSQDARIYENCSVDIFLIDFKVQIDLTENIPLLWEKLKSNGLLIFTGMDSNDTTKKQELLNIFGRVLTFPSSIRVNINFIQNTDIVAIRKPCY